MTDYVSAILSELLSRAIVVGGVMLSMKYIWEGNFVLATGIVVPLLVFAYLLYTDATILE